MIKYSRQREAIKNYLSQTTSHPTADIIYTHIKNQYPNISLGTVYRNLNLLCEQKEIMRINCGEDFERFDGNPIPHNHLLCTRCGCVLDIHMESIDHIKTIASINFKGRIDSYITLFMGLCPECYKKELDSNTSNVTIHDSIC